MRASILAALAASVGVALAQQGAYAQCGGQGWSGATTCVSGYTCVKNNDYYSQCVPGTASQATSKTSSSASTPTSPPQGTVPWWFGVNLSGAEFGETNFSGVHGREFTWYDKSSIDTLMSKGMNHFRINFLMERLTPNSLTASFDQGYLKNLTDQVDYITGKGAYAMIQPHNYGRFYGNIINDTAGFGTWWKNVASQYKSNTLVVFDTNNEYHDMDQQLVFNLNQAAIDGIRSAGATSQCLDVGFERQRCLFVSLKDPQNKLIYQMHQYLDPDGSGTSATCVSSTIFQERLVAATQWLKQNKKLGLIGEYAGGNNAQCIHALQGGLSYLKANKDVWTGSLWWAAGPWWGDYIYSMEPPTGVAYQNVLPSLLSYVS